MQLEAKQISIFSIYNVFDFSFFFLYDNKFFYVN